MAGGFLCISTIYYPHIARSIGALLALYGGGAFLAYEIYWLTGNNIIADFTNGMGLLFLALMGAAVLPLGLGLLWVGEHTKALLRIAAVALGLNGLLRLTVLMVPELREVVELKGLIIELLVFGGVAVLAATIHPKTQYGWPARSRFGE